MKERAKTSACSSSCPMPENPDNVETQMIGWVVFFCCQVITVRVV